MALFLGIRSAETQLKLLKSLETSRTPVKAAAKALNILLKTKHPAVEEAAKGTFRTLYETVKDEGALRFQFAKLVHEKIDRNPRDNPRYMECIDDETKMLVLVELIRETHMDELGALLAEITSNAVFAETKYYDAYAQLRITALHVLAEWQYNSGFWKMLVLKEKDNPEVAGPALTHMLNTAGQWKELVELLQADPSMMDVLALIEDTGLRSGFMKWIKDQQEPVTKRIGYELDSLAKAYRLYPIAFQGMGKEREERYKARLELTQLGAGSMTFALTGATPNAGNTSNLVFSVTQMIGNPRIRTVIEASLADAINAFNFANNIGKQLWAIEVLADFAANNVPLAQKGIAKALSDMREIIEDQTDGIMGKMADYVLKTLDAAHPLTYSYERVIEALGLGEPGEKRD